MFDSDAKGSEFVSLRTQIDKMLLREEALELSGGSARGQKRELTRPASPRFALTNRSSLGKSDKRRLTTEEMTLQEMRESSYKARRLNKRILYSKVPLGVPNVPERPQTTFTEFNRSFRSKTPEAGEDSTPGAESSALKRRLTSEELELLQHQRSFRARSLNRKILKRKERTDEKREPKFTVTAEFALHTNSRSATRREGSLPAG